MLIRLECMECFDRLERRKHVKEKVARFSKFYIYFFNDDYLSDYDFSRSYLLANFQNSSRILFVKLQTHSGEFIEIYQ